ncbi:50S ribosomal protein L15 [Striga asiatica]|uniref:50S ribosomal protein L15 n=1 Tax=Striga asiatica TaxID=4170 RepID=A0A5A7QYI8_STRAF|nr:50S ribosomal protein L15 [Striga asiatica]
MGGHEDNTNGSQEKEESQLVGRVTGKEVVMRTGAEHTPKNPSMVESSSSRKDIAVSHGRAVEKDIRGRRIHLKEGVEGEDISVQELLDGNNNKWNTQRVRDLIAQEDCDAILQIQGIDLMVRDKWRWELGVQGRF